MGTYVNKIDGKTRPNFLASEIGLVQKTRLIPDTMGAEDGTRKIVKAGTVFPANDQTAQGIVFEDVDVTYGDRIASVIVAGRIYKNRVPAEPVAGTGESDSAVIALQKSGIVFEDALETTRA